MTPVDRLTKMLRPAGGGIYTVSTGRAQQLALQQQLYGVATDAEVDLAWRQRLASLESARVVVLGVPSDVGAGFRRGASFGPQEIRRQLLAGQTRYRDDRVVDLGDVFVVPQLLEDEMLSDAQLRASRQALYGDPDAPLPVSPLSIAGEALSLVRELAPRAVPLVLGGDHSVAWPVFEAVARGRNDVGILHFDAHTDLLESRLGIHTCFATWAYHANEIIGRGGRLVQVGIRISGKSREHWESTLDVRQHWADSVTPALGDEIVRHLRAVGVRSLYISNDIDGTDPEYASATGTPEPGGLRPDDVVALIERVGGSFELIGSDLVEVAPPLGDGGSEPGVTLRTAARYVETQLGLTLG